MAYEGTKAYYDKQAELAKQNADIAYTTAMGELARRYGIANRRLESNLEARGILRSGEGNTARTELTAEEEANKAAVEMAKSQAYNQADITLAGQLAALMAGSSSGGGGTATKPATTSAPSTTRPVVAYQGPNVSFAGPYGAMNQPVRPVRDANPRPVVPAGAYGTVRPSKSPVYAFGSADTRERRGR